MRGTRWSTWSLAVAATFVLVASACSSNSSSSGETSGGSSGVNARDFRFVVVTHGQASDPFWSVAANGVNDAAEDIGVTVEYQAPATFDMVTFRQPASSNS